MDSFNSMGNIPLGINFYIGNTSIKPDSQGFLGYACPRISIQSELLRREGGLGWIFADEYPEHNFFHTSGNLGISNISNDEINGIMLFPAKGINTEMRLAIRKVRMK